MIYPRHSTGFEILVVITNLSFTEFQVSSFLRNRRLQVVLNGKSSHEYPVNVGVAQGSILGPTPFLLYINGLHDDVICNIAVYAGNKIWLSKANVFSFT